MLLIWRWSPARFDAQGNSERFRGERRGRHHRTVGGLFFDIWGIGERPGKGQRRRSVLAFPVRNAECGMVQEASRFPSPSVG
jgi:hypothetical protein